MKTPKKQILVGAFLTIAILTSTAQAGLFGWLTSANSPDQVATKGSFDQLYASIGSTQTPETSQPINSDSLNAVEGTSTPAGGIAKVLRRNYTVQLSGYSSEVAQTDDSPFITAKGTHVRDGIVATNMFPFGTVLKFPSLYGDKIFVVEDRMNKRYQNNIDIWFTEKAAALKLGRRTVQVQVIQ